MRHTPEQAEILRNAAHKHFGPGAGILLFGSRTDDSARGGNINLSFEPRTILPNPFVAVIHLEIDLQNALGDQKIDILVGEPGNEIRRDTPNCLQHWHRTMNDDIKASAESNRVKTLRVIALVTASLDDYRPYDPTIAYTPKALEPYDAPADRFVRAVEYELRYFRSREMQEFAEQSETTRTNLGRMERLELADSSELWLAIRNIRNRIVEDDMPEEIAQMFELIAGEFGRELKRLAARLEN